MSDGKITTENQESNMKHWALLAIVAATVVSRRCVTHREAGALLRDHKLEGQLTEDHIRAIRTGAIYTKLRKSDR